MELFDGGSVVLLSEFFLFLGICTQFAPFLVNLSKTLVFHWGRLNFSPIKTGLFSVV